MHRVPHRRKALGLHADDVDARINRPRRSRDAADHSAAADRDHQRVDLRLLGEHLERDRALPRGHRQIVVGMDDREPALLRELQAVRARIVEGVALDHDSGAEAARVLDLHCRRKTRHHDGGRNGEPLRVIRDALRMVAGRHREHAARALLVAQLGNLVERAALLERRGELQVLELEKHLAAGNRRQGARWHARRIEHMAAQALGSSVDVFGSQRHAAIVA